MKTTKSYSNFDDEFMLDWDGQLLDRSYTRQPKYPGFEQDPSIHPTSSKDAKLKYAHYSDDRFKKAQLVYLACSPEEIKGLSWDYSDRIYQWDYQKANDASAIASESHQGRTAGWAEAFVNHYYDGKVELKAIATGFNLSNGYDYFVYGYRVKEGGDRPTSQP